MQTSVSTARVIGKEGALAEPDAHIVSRLAEEAIKPGRFVHTGTDSREALLPSAAGHVTGGVNLGVSMLDEAREFDDSAGEYAIHEPMSVVRRGVIWMLAEDACTEGGAVYVRHVVSGSEEYGTVRSDADGSDADIAPSCVFRSTTTGTGELIKVELNLPG